MATTFFTVMENDLNNKDTPAVAVFESVNRRQAAQRFCDRYNKGNAGKFTISTYKIKD